MQRSELRSEEKRIETRARRVKRSSCTYVHTYIHTVSTITDLNRGREYLYTYTYMTIYEFPNLQIPRYVATYIIYARRFYVKVSPEFHEYLTSVRSN